MQLGRHQRPLPLPGFAADWSARTWTLDDLARCGSGREVTVERGDGAHAEAWLDAVTTERMALDTFIDRMRRQPLALAQWRLARAMPELARDLPCVEPWLWRSPWAARTAFGPTGWLGPAGTWTPTHFDYYDNLYVQLVGRKVFWLAAPDAVVPLRRRERHFSADSIADGRRVELAPGDALYLPPGWWHRVQARTDSLSVSWWWTAHRLRRSLRPHQRWTLWRQRLR